MITMRQLAIVLILSTLVDLINTTIVINVGHVYFSDSEIPVVRMALNDLEQQGIVPEAYDFKLYSRMGCAVYYGNMSAIHGAAEATNMYFNDDVDVFFGSPCSEETTVIGQMAAKANWNLPMISFLSADDSLSDKTIYSTLARTSVTTQTFYAQAVKFVIAQIGWKKVGYVGSQSTMSSLNLPAIKSTLLPIGVSIYPVVINVNATWQSVAKNKAIVNLKANARVILVGIDSEMNSSVPFMAAAHSLGYTADPSFVFIIFSINNNYQSRPWDADYDGMSYPYLRQAYEGAYILRIEGMDDVSVNTFRQKLLDSQNYTNPRGDDARYMPMYDAVVLYAKALNKSFVSSGNESVYDNGAFMFEQMKNVEFEGITSHVQMNNNAERIPSYQFTQIPQGVVRTYTVLMNIDSTSVDGCDPTVMGNLCYPYNVTVTADYLAIAWPPDVPKCGFSNELCNNTLLYVLGGVLIASVIAIAAGFYIMKKRKESRLYLMPWQVAMESVKLLSSGTVVSSMISMTNLRNSEMSTNSKNVTSSLQQALVGGNTRASVRKYKQVKRINFNRQDLNSLYYTKQLSHDNLNTFIGLTYNNLKNDLFFLWKLCTRGSLQDIVANDDLKLDMDFKASFINDIVKGMLFLHGSEIKEHGALRSSNCLVDNHWTVKLTDFGVNRVISDLLKHKEIEYTEEGVQEPTPYKLLYMAPEHLRTYMSRKTIEVSQAGDIYAIGIIMHEVLYRLEPYSDLEDSAEDIIRKIASLDATSMRTIRPKIPSEPALPQELILMIQQCWFEAPDTRPNIKRIKKVVDATLRTSGTITDHMMKMMEDYASNLEKIVHERTALLEEAQQQAEGLLLQMLPKSVAQDLKLGRHVAPQTYEEATVLFSDIAGFTSLCSTSGPLEIVAFLNGVFSGFDAIIAQHSAYKVETIGDAYMMVSGVPEVIGDRHVEEIASIAVAMKEFVADFKVAHRPGLQLQIRTGFHSGPVATGVVGLSAPRYCLFGDTVNMASRMESNSIIGRIQISAFSFTLLSRKTNDFAMEERGYVEIKGKGQQLTYWLHGRTDEIIRDAPVPINAPTPVKKPQNKTIVPKKIKQNFF